MGKIRIKQIGEGFEEVVKLKKKKVVERENPPALEMKDEKNGSRKSVSTGEGKPTYSSQIHGRSARYKKARKRIIKEAVIIEDAVEKVKQIATASFIETVELHLNVEKIGIRVQLKLPHPLSSKKKVLYITSDTAKAKKEAGKQDGVELMIKGEEAISQINSAGSAPDVDQLWAEPAMMPKLATIAKIIGPLGLMPNPKHGTLVEPGNIGKKLQSLLEGNVTLSTEKKAAVIHSVVGKTDMTDKQITDNVKAVIEAITAKDIKSAYISSTMGPSVQIKLATV